MMQLLASRSVRSGISEVYLTESLNSTTEFRICAEIHQEIQKLLINQEQEWEGVTGNTLAPNDCKQLIEADVTKARSDDDQKSLCGNSCYASLNAKYKIMLDNSCFDSDDADKKANGQLRAAAYQIACQANADGKYCMPMLDELVKKAGVSFSLCDDIVSELGCCFQSYRQYLQLGTPASVIAVNEAQTECSAKGVQDLNQLCPCVNNQHAFVDTPFCSHASKMSPVLAIVALIIISFFVDTCMTNTQEKTAISIVDGHFVDQFGRIALLRGVNLGGSSKLPYGYGHTDDQNMSDFFDGATHVSFVGRPFPLKEADLHLSRLQRWGFTLLRFVVTWEAIEHAGPGQIDHEYLQYLRAVIEKAADYNMLVYIDPHQDVWSRWTGGDGAPMWTLECIGFEPRNFEVTKAALCLETCGLPASQFPKMIWPTNYGKLACATMFTLFWAGRKYAPKCFVDGVQIQEYLQSHYLSSMAALAQALKGLTNIVGFGTMNEPSCGFIGVTDLEKPVGLFQNGYAPTALQGMALGEGIAQDVGFWNSSVWTLIRGKPSRVDTVDPHGLRAWKDGFECVWKNAGVWGLDAEGKPEVLQPDYFSNADFGRDFFLPFARKFALEMQLIFPKAMIFVEMPPVDSSDVEFPKILSDDIPNAVNAMHWYDAVTLLTLTWRSYFTVDYQIGIPAFGNEAVRRVHHRQLAHVASFGRTKMENAPTLIGETGIPYNLCDARAYISGDFSVQVDAMDNTISNLESQLLSYALWNYTTDNSHEFGDLWNLEDLSISSPDSEMLAIRLAGGHTRRLDDSARGLKGFARPHARKISGLPLKSAFTMSKAEYILEYETTKVESSAPTEIYVPYVHYPGGYRVTTSDGHCTIEKHENYDIITYAHDSKVHKHHVLVSPRVPIRGDQRGAYAPLYIAIAAIALIVPVFTLCKRR
ncbi:hypothetical protein F442_01271 [Plasmopara halstedii]|uniref:Glycosyl hydrolase n=1 Tax=Plasmopara halstedii TaxID=4781 RepID=A0A0P1AUC5_PLAHL|nr:hypothetical protein F442_01271 [Plasmopara halstedii]CEG44958.1 hypothetical protein F442_01271 [Plasmopara halstedii]|eukprot:XP_024581327.1 hypothetical protein F442_01271 [Plasmopara halstedii]